MFAKLKDAMTLKMMGGGESGKKDNESSDEVTDPFAK